MSREAILKRWHASESLLERMTEDPDPDHIEWLSAMASRAFAEYCEYLDSLKPIPVEVDAKEAA